MPIDVLVPPVGTTVDTLTLISWYKQEGDAVVKDEPLFAVQTDKATLDIEAPASGILCRVSAEPGDDVVSLTRIASIRQADEVVEPIAKSSEVVTISQQPQVPKLPAASSATTKSITRRNSRIFISPRAKKLAEANGVDWRALIGTGPEGAIVERDVPPPQSAIAAQSLASATSATLTAYADATGLVEFRDRIRETGVPLSYDSLLAKILARVLVDYPQMNASGQTSKVHIGVTVNIDQGLLTAVVRNACGKRLSEIETELGTISQLARNGKGPAESARGASFVLANLGEYGIDSFSSLIDLNECAILSVGQIRREPALVDSLGTVRHMVWLSLNFNRQSVDAGHAMRFLQRVVQFVEEPHRLLI